MVNKIWIALMLASLGYTLSWFQSSMQFVWDWWEDKQILAVVIFSIPCGMLFVYSTKLAYEYTESLWSVRFIMFGISYLVFPILTWFMMKETPFNFKTMSCILLSILILLIQIRE